MKTKGTDVFVGGIMFPQGVFKDKLIFQKPSLSRKGGFV
jgi:hypothetical protein